MKLYLDTGNIEEIKKAASQGLIDGVTTNPSLIAKAGRDFLVEIKDIVKILKKEKIEDFTVSAEVIDTSSYKSIVSEARKLSKISKHVLVKVPLTSEGLRAVRILSRDGVRCNVTLCFSANQALLAAKAGAWCVSPFIGRVDDEGFDGLELIEDIRKIFDNYKFKTKILSASIRTTEHVRECALIGSDIVTLPPSIFEKLYYNPLTQIGIEKFEKDWSDYKKKLK